MARPLDIKKINLKQCEKLVKAGFTDKQLADFFDITEASLNNYKKRYPKFFESLKDWKKEADEKVEKCLYQRAIGYEYDEVVYEKSKIGGLGIKLSKGEIEEIKHCDTNKTKITTKQVIPDVTAQIFWLKNRQPERWKDTTSIEHSAPEALVEKFASLTASELITKANGIISGKSS